MPNQIHNHRLYIEPFTPQNDIPDPATGKRGIAVYSKALGVFLKCFGYAEKITLEGKVYYVNKKSYANWKTRHPDFRLPPPNIPTDSTSSPLQTTNKRATKLSDEHKARLMAKAEGQVSSLITEAREKILEEIKQHLDGFQKSGGITLKSTAVIYPNPREASLHQQIDESVEAFFDRNDLGINLHVSRLGGYVLGHKKFKKDVIAAAEAYIKDKMEGDDKKKELLLDLVRLVVYQRDFYTSPKRYFEQNAPEGSDLADDEKKVVQILKGVVSLD
jgi:hypothetical protein